MIYFKGYPRANGVTDFCDSAVMAGLLSVFKLYEFSIPGYFDIYGNPLRSGASDIADDKCFDPMTFSRDQLTCLIAGYYAQNRHVEVAMIYDKVVENNWLCPNNDILSPSNRGHINFCAGKPVSWMQEKWLYLDVMFSALVKPKHESNQLLCMLMIRDVKFLRLYTKLYAGWYNTIYDYWCGWRNEPELAESMVLAIKEKIK